MKIIKSVKDFLTGKLKYNGEHYTKRLMVDGINIWIDINFRSSSSFEKEADDVIKKVSELKRKYHLLDNKITFVNSIKSQKYRTRKYLGNIEFDVEWSTKVIKFRFSDIGGDNEWGTGGPIPEDIKQEMFNDIEKKLWNYEINFDEFSDRGYIIVEIEA